MLLEMPAIQVENVVVLAGAGITTPALNFLLARGIGLVLLSANGAFRGRLSGDLAKNISLRRQQYRRADDEAFSLGIARAVVVGKLANCRVRCLEMASGKEPLVVAALEGLQRLITRASMAQNRAELMGIEGQGTQHYFAVVRHILRQPWVFQRRARRPPPDPVNALLSLLATFLQGTCYGALEAVGLDPACGFLHGEQYGRASLALDLMEEFRPILADAMALTLLHKRMLQPDDFVPAQEGGVRLTTNGWRVVTTQYHRRLQERVRPQRDAVALPYQQLIEHQARRLRAVIEGAETIHVPYRAR